jgi:hypothetical protein
MANAKKIGGLAACLALIQVCSATGLWASWSFTASLVVSNCQTGGYIAPTLPAISGIPNQSLCQSVRAQILGIRECIANLSPPYGPGGTCCVYYNCSVCSGFDDSSNSIGSAGGAVNNLGDTQGTAYFASGPDTETQDWNQQTQVRLQSLGQTLNQSLAQIQFLATGDANFDASYQQQLNQAYGGALGNGADSDASQSQANASDSDAVPVGSGGESDFFYQLQLRQTGDPEQRYDQNLGSPPEDNSGAATVDQAAEAADDQDAEGSQEVQEGGGSGGADAESGNGEESVGPLQKLEEGANEVVGGQVADTATEAIADKAAEVAELGEDAGGTAVNIAAGAGVAYQLSQGNYSEAGKEGVEAVVGTLTMTSGMALAAGQAVGGVVQNQLANFFGATNAVLGNSNSGQQTYSNIYATFPTAAQFIGNCVGMKPTVPAQNPGAGSNE